MANIEDEISKATKDTIQRKAKEVNDNNPLEMPEIKSSNEPIPDIDSEALAGVINGPGYNTGANVGKIKDPSVDVPQRKNVATPLPTQNENAAQINDGNNSQLNRNEPVSDIDKDKGMLAPGYENPAEKSNNATPTSEIPERDNGVHDNNAQNQMINQNSNQDGELEKKDGLDKKDSLDDPTKAKDNKKNQDSKDANNEKNNQPSSNNGYGALKNNSNVQNQRDGTSLARKNLDHNNRMQQGQRQENGTGKENGSNKTKTTSPENKTSDTSQGSSSKNPLSNIGSKLKNRLSNFGKGKGKGNVAKDVAGKGMQALKKKALEFMAMHPFACIVIGVVILLIILIIACASSDGNDSKSNKGGGAHCTYNLLGISSVGEVQLEGVQVELVNCDASPSDYTVLETIDFEKYVLGVALAEVGSNSPDEAIKSQIIAARGAALSRNVGMCPSNQDDCFYGYNSSTGKIRMRACEADQVYWDYEKDIYREDRGAISLYSPEINSGTIWKTALSEDRITEVKELANQVKGKVLIDDSSKVVKTGYNSSTSQQFIDMANQGYTYEEILATVYSESRGLSSAECNSYGNIDYGDYVLSSDGDEILHEPLEDFLESKGTSLEELNSLIEKNVQKAGYGTRAGVVAAAVTLIGELGNKYDVRVPYYWSGGHYDGVVDGALGYWGSNSCHFYANGQHYNYCGLDCSGFVPWAIKNGGFKISQMLAGDFVNLDGAKKVRLTNEPVLEPGDLLEGEGHIVLVIGIEESTGKYICAEASGNEYGVWFSRRSFDQPGYYGVKMDGFYDTHAR